MAVATAKVLAAGDTRRPIQRERNEPVPQPMERLTRGFTSRGEVSSRIGIEANGRRRHGLR